MFFAVGAILAGLSVAAGAFGAHALKAILTPEMLTVFETGARYQMYHALALIVVGLSLQNYASQTFRKAGVAFLVGVVLFSGSLYALALSGIRGLGALTPLGGVAFLIGWGLLAWGWWRQSG
jgi:uncharacterized membrane protein YgdD (TMEM256/DUF423 family)